MRAINDSIDIVHVLDCLPDKDRADKHAVEIEKSVKQAGYVAQISYVNTKSERIGTLQGIAASGAQCLLHIIAHGNKDCIGIAGKELITWKELGPLLEEINNSMKGKLILNMSSCSGLHSIRAVMESTKDPVFGVIGPAESITFELAQKVNSLFYDLLHSGYSIPEIMDFINGRLKVVHSITAQGFRYLSQHKTP